MDPVAGRLRRQRSRLPRRSGSMDSRIGALLAVAIPLALIQLGLMIWAIVDLVKRERVRGGSKLLWALVIVFVSTIGSIVYLVWGRQE